MIHNTSQFRARTDAISSLAARRTLLAQPVAVLLVLPASAQAAAPETTDLPLRAAEAQWRGGAAVRTREVLAAAAAELRLHLVREGRDARQAPRLLLLQQEAHSKIKLPSVSLFFVFVPKCVRTCSKEGPRLELLWQCGEHRGRRHDV